MKCPRCGSEIKDGRLFCEKCGEEIRIVQDFEPEMEVNMEGNISIEDEISMEENLSADDILSDDTEKSGTEPWRSGVLQKIGKRVSLLTVRQRMIMAVVLVLLLSAVLGLAVAGVQHFSADYQYDKALEYINKKDYAKACSYAERAVELEPGNVEYLVRLAGCFSAMGNEEETIELCLRIIGMDESNEAAYKRLISIYEKRKEYDIINELLLSCGNEQIVSQYPGFIAKPPEFSFKGGVYNETLSLKMLANTQGTIYYTVDGSKPDESGLVYSSPVFLESGQYDIRAVFINSYGVESDETQEHYFVDVTVPEAPLVSPEEGEYSRPTIISVEVPEDYTVYYTTDGTLPTADSIQYTGPFPMPVGVNTFRFVSYSAAGVAGVETQVRCSLNLHAALSIEAAKNKLLFELVNAGIIQDMSGSVKTGSGHNVYGYKYAVTVDGTDYYLYREYYEDDAGNRAGTGTDYVVSIMEGQCYKAVQAAKETSAAGAAVQGDGGKLPDEPETSAKEASEENADAKDKGPWSTLILQDINSGSNPE